MAIYRCYIIYHPYPYPYNLYRETKREILIHYNYDNGFCNNTRKYYSNNDNNVLHLYIAV